MAIKEKVKKMIELIQNTTKSDVISLSEEVVQLSHVRGESIFINDPEGNKIEIKTTDDGRKIVFTRDEGGRSIAIEERDNGTKLYHISCDSAGLPSSHEVRLDRTEIVYFYNASGILQHFVELRPNGDRVSTILTGNESIYSIEQKQIGGIVFTGWQRNKNNPKEAMVWLHPDGDVSTYGDDEVVVQLFSKFSKYLDGVC